MRVWRVSRRLSRCSSQCPVATFRRFCSLTAVAVERVVSQPGVRALRLVHVVAPRHAVRRWLRRVPARPRNQPLRQRPSAAPRRHRRRHHCRRFQVGRLHALAGAVSIAATDCRGGCGCGCGFGGGARVIKRHAALTAVARPTAAVAERAEADLGAGKPAGQPRQHLAQHGAARHEREEAGVGRNVGPVGVEPRRRGEPEQTARNERRRRQGPNVPRRLIGWIHQLLRGEGGGAAAVGPQRRRDCRGVTCRRHRCIDQGKVGRAAALRELA